MVCFVQHVDAAELMLFKRFTWELCATEDTGAK